MIAPGAARFALARKCRLFSGARETAPLTQDGKHAVVTGGGSGIGLATAVALVKAGWTVTLAGRNKAKLLAARAMTNASQIAVADVTEPDDVQSTVRRAAEESGPIRLLVNNAGGVTSAPFEKTSLKAWRESLDLNLMGAVHGIQAVLPGMKAAGTGRIVNIASTAGLVGYRYVSAYVAAKHAVVGLTKALALELAKTGITVNAVCPGFTDTASSNPPSRPLPNPATARRTKRLRIHCHQSARPACQTGGSGRGRSVARVGRSRRRQRRRASGGRRRSIMRTAQ
jgi:3-hydroxybutyrate dehydrogenase